MRTVDELMQTPFWIIDLLPHQVPPNSPGQYFAIEQYFLQEPRRTEVKQAHANLILKVNSYMDIRLEEGGWLNPTPEVLANAVHTTPINILVGDSLITSNPDDSYLTLYDPDEELLELIGTLVKGEGLYLWKPLGLE